MDDQMNNQPQAPQQPMYQPPMAPPPQDGNGMATASLVLGIISLFCFGLVLGIIGLILGILAKKKMPNNGKATAGIVLSILGLVGWAVVMIFFSTALFEMFSMFS